MEVKTELFLKIYFNIELQFYEAVAKIAQRKKHCSITFPYRIYNWTIARSVYLGVSSSAVKPRNELDAGFKYE